MSKIRGRDTTPELVVRRLAHRLGFRFRLHVNDLPARPDLVFPRHRLVVLVHGCFWHRHRGCRYAYTPKSRTDFWTKKLEENVSRDGRKEKELRRLGWRVLVIWECQTRDDTTLRAILAHHLSAAQTEQPTVLRVCTTLAPEGRGASCAEPLDTDARELQLGD